MDWQAAWVSVKLACATTFILLLICPFIALWLSASTKGYKAWVKALIALPQVLPPTVLGFYILFMLGPASTGGRLYRGMTGSMIPFSFEGLLIASIISSLPFMVQPLTASFSEVNRHLIEVSYSLGASRLRTFFKIILPLSLPGLIAGTVLSFAHVLGEFGVVLLVGGNIPGVTRTLSITIYDQVQALNYAAAARTSLVMLVFSFLLLGLTYNITQRFWKLW